MLRGLFQDRSWFGFDDIQEVERKAWVRVAHSFLEAGKEYNPWLGRWEYFIRLTRL